jgi:predicted amidohydrolase YtcJ
VVDVLLVNGTILSMDSSCRVHSAVAIRDGRIAAVGESQALRAQAPIGATVLDLRGRTVIPGLIDGHNHFSVGFLEPRQVDCSTPPLGSLGEVLDRIRAHAQTQPPGGWIRGWGFHWSRVREQRNPTREELDEVSPRNPLVIMDASYHGCFTNSLALLESGIDRHSPPGRCGEIVLDEAGEPTGTLLESAMDMPESLSWRAYVERFPEDALRLLAQNGRRHLAMGITTVSDALVRPEASALYARAWAEGDLPLNIHQMHGGRKFLEPPRVDALSADAMKLDYGDRLRGGTIKLFMDAVHPSPAIDQTVAGLPGRHTGLNYYSRGEALELALQAVSAGLQVAVHALGDCAVQQTLDVFSAIRQTSTGSAASLRIEHFVLASPEQAARAAALGVIVVTNPGFVHRWGDQYLHRWRWDGRPELRVLPMRTLLDCGVVVAAGSDYPCDGLNPFVAMWAAVTRRSWTEEPVFEGEAVSPLEALRMYTSSAAMACGRESEEGTIEVGKRANLVVLDRNPLVCSSESLPSTLVLATYLDGAAVFEHPSWQALSVGAPDRSRADHVVAIRSRRRRRMP